MASPGCIYLAGHGRPWSCSPQVLRYHPLAAHLGREAGVLLLGVRLGLVKLAMIAPQFSSSGKQFNFVLPMLSAAVTVVGLISPLLALRGCMKDDIEQQGFGPKDYPFQGFCPTGSFLER